MFTILIISICLILLIGYLRVLYECLRKAKVLNVTNSNGQYKSGEINVIEYSQPPGPLPWPVLGNLALLGQYDVPFQGFTELAKKFGDIYSLTLGTTRCLIVNNLDLIREVLNQNGKFFGGRPDFLRYHKLFGGDRNNSLALCDWSSLQQKRRNLARRHCSPRDASSFYAKMSDVGCFEMQEFMDKLHNKITPNEDVEIKPLIQQTCANMFSQYMCSVRFDYEDTEFQQIVHYFDEIFWEINQGYAVDFLPWLAPFYKNHMKKIINWSSTIRKFILDRVINDREQYVDVDEPEKDFTDALLKSLAEDENVSRDTIIFMLEDFIGGHSAVGNLVMLALAYVIRNPDIASKIQKEVDELTENGKRKITLMDTENMPYTVATIYETLRYSSSPIVPHVATEDAVIAGYGVTKGSIVFINNYNLNTSPKYWDKPELFNPERFLEKIQISATTSSPARRNSESSDSGVESDKYQHIENNNETFEKKVETNRLKKNIPHFLPFSIGKRTCIGQNLVRGFGFIMLANILQKYDIGCKNPETIQINPACVALPAKTFSLTLTPRKC